MKKVFPIILEKPDIFKHLNEKKKEFLESDYPFAAIDISRASIPNSTQLGEITVIIRAAQSRGGTTFIFTENIDALELLDNVHFSSIATVFKDKEKFDKVLSGEINPEQFQKNKDVELKPSSTQKITNALNKQENNFPIFNVALITMLVLNLLFTLGIAFYSNTKSNSNKQIMQEIIKSDKELNSKVLKLSNKIQELEILNEISE